MSTRGEWDALVTALREAPSPYEAPELGALWTLACADAPRHLAKFKARGQLDDARIQDLARDWLVSHLPALLAPNVVDPQGFFGGCLVRAALSWLRRASAKVAASDPDADRGGSRPAPEHPFMLDATRFAETLSTRERDVLSGVAWDEDRESLARGLGLSRANVDQIVSRARKRFRDEDP